MGLAVSQVRLLALTSRKADIELRMQVNSKRKQMLTRKSTDLAQQYYNRLQDSNIQYATSAGYEDVNYNYLMGKTNTSGNYTDDFLRQIMIQKESSTVTPQKFENKMILTDQFGQVVTNNEMAEIVAKVDKSYPSNMFSVADQTSYGIVELIKEHKTVQGYNSLFGMFTNSDGTINQTNLQKMLALLKLMVKNEGNVEGGTVYTNDGSTFYNTLEGLNHTNTSDLANLKQGYMYSVKNGSGGDYSSDLKSAVYLGSAGFFHDPAFSPTEIKYLANIVSYFAPIISAALTNGTTAKVNIVPKNNEMYGDEINDPGGRNFGAENAGKLVKWVDGTGVVKGFYKIDGSGVAHKMGNDIDPIGQNQGSITQPDEPTYENKLAKIPNEGDWFIWEKTDSAGNIVEKVYYQNVNGKPKQFSGDNAAAKFYDNFKFEATSNDAYSVSTNTNELQAGFKSGVFQLCLVDDVQRGIYHKNTTLKYFTHMNYVVDKADSSKREEITAWFNAENAAISEQETYWDTEIQNLSTELTSINSEIEAVKKLKSDSIKQVFNWGGN